MSLKEKLLKLDIVINNEYLDKYVELIESNRDTKREKFKTQKHHIIPRYYYEINSLKLNNSKENLVHLLYKNHVLAHLYLSLCSTTTELTYSNFMALKYMLRNLTSNDSDEIQELYEKSRKLASVYNCMYNDVTKNNHLKAMRSEDVRQRISKTMKEKYKNGELFNSKHRENLSKSQKNLIHLKRGQELTIIKQENLEEYLQNGWEIGWCSLSEEHKQKLINSHLGKKYSQELRDKLSKAHQGQVPWNKGRKNCFTQEARDKIANSVKGFKWMNNGTTCIQVKSQDITKYEQNGYILGRLFQKKNMKGGD